MTKRENNAYEYSMYLLKKCNNEKLIMVALVRILELIQPVDYESKGIIRALTLKSGIVEN